MSAAHATWGSEMPAASVHDGRGDQGSVVGREPQPATGYLRDVLSKSREEAEAIQMWPWKGIIR